MHLMKRLVGTILLISFFGVAVVAIWPQPASGAAGPLPLNVQVVNTPLPVSMQGTANFTGNVEITGTPNVNVTGMPTVSAAQSGTWTVGLADGASVNIANPASDPVIVRNVDVREPVSFKFSAPVGPSSSECNRLSDVYVVPVGKRLVLEHVSGQMLLPLGQSVISAALLWESEEESFVPQRLGDNSSFNWFSFNHEITRYVQADSQIFFGLCRSGFFLPGVGNYRVTATGYLTPAP